MNKTVNINLAGIFFHIDEDAFLKLQRYLKAIKRSFTDSQGRDEIIADIEARIAELFNEKRRDEKEVIGIKEVEEVITVMGQPEDYRIDEEIFEDESTTSDTPTTKTKQVFRDLSNSYIGGVSSGLAHYIGLDPIWVRLTWILLTVFSSGAFILIYIAFWIFVPEAKTTADFLAMKGEDININTIEKKIKEGFSDVAGKVKDVDYKKYSAKVKSGSTTFFETIGSILLILLKIFTKIIGVFLIIISGLTLIGLFIGVFTFGTFGFIETPITDYIDAINYPNIPLWLVSLLLFFLAGIPTFFFLYLGLKITISNLKSIGTTGKLSLLAVWVLSVIGAIIILINGATQEAYEATVLEDTKELRLTPSDTLTIKMVRNKRYLRNFYHKSNFKIKRDENDNKVLVIQDIKIFITENKEDTIPKISIKKTAEGNSYSNAKERAASIIYEYEVRSNSLLLNGYAITDIKNKYNDQEIEITLSIPEGMTILADKNTSRYNNSWKSNEYLSLHDKEGNYVQLINGEFICNTCPKNEWEYKDSDNNNDEIHININDDDENAHLKINDDGVRIKNEEIDIKIDKNGIKIKTDN